MSSDDRCVELVDKRCQVTQTPGVHSEGVSSLAGDSVVFQNTRFPRRRVGDRVGLLPAAAGDVDETFYATYGCG